MLTTTVDDLLKTYTEEKEKEVYEWFGNVRHELFNWMENHPKKRVHSVRARMKDRSHLRDKIERWPQKHKANDVLTKENFFEKIEDLAGVRILALYRHDVAIVDHFVYRSNVWRVLKAEANYDVNRPDDERFFKGLGFTKKTPERRLIGHKDGYASIHYILVKKHLHAETAKRSHRKCELQVRTIHEEAWGEFSHEFTYPHDQVDALASNLIKRLSALLHQAEDIVSDIRRSPADARLFRKVHEQLWRNATGGRLPPHITFDVVHQMLAEVPFTTRSALLAAIGILTETVGSKPGIAPGKRINAQQVITLGFGDPDYWHEDELQKLYLEAHAAWDTAGAPSEDRQVFKFFVWFPSKPVKAGEPWVVKVPTIFQNPSFTDRVHFYLLKPETFAEVNRALQGYQKNNLDSCLSFKRTQFFLWRTNNIHEFASLPYRQGMPSKEIKGFYSPSPDPDLLSGMLWLPDSEDEEGIIIKALHVYADILMAIKDDAALVTKLVGKEVRISGSLSSKSKTKINSLVKAKLKAVNSAVNSTT